MRIIISFLPLVIASALIAAQFGCGSGNVFEPLVASKKNDKDKGKSAMQSGDYDKAITYLQDYLRDHPEDNQARSMLATALLKKTGVDELQLAAKIADSQKNAGSSDWNAIVDVMPAGSDANISNLQTAVDTLSAIPAEVRTKEQNYQLAVASASLAVSVVKKTTDDGTGKYTPTDEKLNAMTDDEAKTIVDSLATTAEASAAAGSEVAGASKLAGISEQIKASEGATEREKLVAFLKTKRT